MGFFNRYIPGPGPAWPYTNMQQINLDWIIYEVKKLGHDVEEYKTELDQLGVSVEEFRDYIENIDDEIQQKINEEMPLQIAEALRTGGFNDVISLSHKRRVVCIGDSYGTGWTPDGWFNGWPGKVKTILNLSNDDFSSASIGGAGFGILSSDPTRYVPTLIEQAADDISNHETVTDVIIAMGYNDYQFISTPSNITTGINSAISKAKNLFPFATIHIFAIGFTSSVSIQTKLKEVYKLYANSSVNIHFKNISDCLYDKNYFVSDGIHPNESGQDSIANHIVHALNNSDNIINNIAHQIADTSFTLLLGGEKTVNNWLFFAQLQNDMVLASPNTVNVVELTNATNVTGGTWIKLAKLTNSPICGYQYANKYISSPAQLAYKTSASNNQFNTLPVILSLAPDPDNNDYNVYLWMQLVDSSTTGFTIIYNMTYFALLGVNIKIPFITK